MEWKFTLRNNETKATFEHTVPFGPTTLGAAENLRAAISILQDRIGRGKIEIVNVIFGPS